ncbi:disease resistance-like protein isoform X1 [Cinnamomum micranthum f. kanehirae]|uniref:Disease resistance-like protein isoform X1 n=1 Tax=Cinnamomum micranthum f. kanehirae TaxID=337451 RepID=A0A3S3MXW5_9MAGN|nr:disease resistance-like protein isoform X1 [Cinnamomum micranthum f. kanehirae]
MEIIASIIRIIPNLCSQISHQTEYVRHLKNNVDALMVLYGELKAECEDTESKEGEASREKKMLTSRARTWLGQAGEILAEIDSIKLQFDQRRSFCNGCFPDLWSDYKLGKRAFEKLKDIPLLIQKKKGFELVARSPPLRVIEMDVPTVGQSSAQRTKEKIWNLLHDEHSSVICIYGMGGIGKSTLMKAINNELHAFYEKKEKEEELRATREFDYVIWVTVSKQLNLQKIQKEIMSRLDLKFDEKDSYQDRSIQLREWLSNKRYLLILDDLWNSFNLSEVGIPTDMENRSKIAITTRIANMSAVQVCSDMKAEMIRVETLAEDEAWDLFAANVGKEVLHQPRINDYAKEVAMECGGLPLAIVVVAKAMRGQKKKELWEDALRALRAAAPEIEGMEPQVFRPLKLSYDDLSDEKVKMCFLYCSLFPEDHEIFVKLLIRWWIMEGFIDNVNNLVDASNKGHRIIEELKRRCLLEEGIRDDRVKMHDVIRDLALYIASSSCKEGPKFLVKANVGLNVPPREETWREFERISLMMNEITELPIRPACPNLISLFLSENRLIIAVPRSFFELMPALQVLDLSGTRITSLSVSSSSLLNLRALILRGCFALTEVPFLGQLKELQFLDIKSSGIRTENDLTLSEVGKLKRLTILKITIKEFDCVENDVFLQQLPKLKKFEVVIGPHLSDPLNLLDCMKNVHINGGNNYSRGVKVMVAHTEGLELCDADVRDVSQLVGDANGLRGLSIYQCEKMEYILDWSDVGENALQNIEELHLYDLPSLQKLFKGEVPQRCLRRLNKIVVFGCDQLKSLFSSKMVQNLDQLQSLHVENCDGLEEIIEGHDKSLPENPFPQLRKFTLEKLPKLKSIIRRDTLALPSLIELKIAKCPDLRLPKRPDIADWPNSYHLRHFDFAKFSPFSWIVLDFVVLAVGGLLGFILFILITDICGC